MTSDSPFVCRGFHSLSGVMALFPAFVPTAWQMLKPQISTLYAEKGADLVREASIIPGPPPPDPRPKLRAAAPARPGHDPADRPGDQTPHRATRPPPPARPRGTLGDLAPPPPGPRLLVTPADKIRPRHRDRPGQIANGGSRTSRRRPPGPDRQAPAHPTAPRCRRAHARRGGRRDFRRGSATRPRRRRSCPGACPGPR